MCCVQDGRAIISKKAPIDLGLCPEPVPPEIPIEVDFDGCSVPDVIHLAMTMESGGLLYSGDRNEPTPPGQGDARFSFEGSGEPLGGPCDRHDECYQTCGTARGSCDEDFGNDLMAVCAGVSGIVTAPSPANPEILIDYQRRSQCEMWATIYHGVVAQVGFLAHDAGQETHCDCACS
jgi:hypothetical protein